MDITELKAIIDANIFENTSQAITGDALNGVLNLIADSLGEYVPVADIFDEAGTIRSALLPSYVDDVLEFSTRDAFPAVGEGGKIYLAADTNLSYRWGGSEYVIIAQSLALGETSSTAYRGDRGKIAYDHSQTSHRLRIAGLEISALGGSIDTDALASALSLPELRRAVAVHIGDGSIHITADERTAWNKVASLFGVDENNDIYVKNGKGFYTEGFISAGGKSSGGGESGSSYTQWEWEDIKSLQQSETGALASAYSVKEVYTELNTVINALASSATKVSFAPNLTGGKAIGTLTIDGAGTTLYAPQNYAWGDITGKPTTIAGFGITDALTTANYNSYAPKLDGTGATGTWGISISGNAASATQLQTARTIWGQSFDGTGNVGGALSGVTDITASGNITIASISLKGNNDAKLTYDNGAWHLSGNLLVDGYITAGGVGSSSGGGGIDSAAMWALLGDATNEQINKTHISSALEGYQSIIPDLDTIRNNAANGNTAFLWGNHSGLYLPLTGGTMSNTNVVTNLNADLLDGYHASNLYIRGADNNVETNESINSFNATRDSDWAWNQASKATLKLVAHNNALSFLVAGAINERAAIIQVGHSDPHYANALGPLYLNKFGGTVYIGTIEAATINSNVASASKWATPRTITLTGSVTGSVSIDGSGDVSLATTTNHTHSFASLTSKPTTISGYGITDALTTANYNSYAPTLTGGGASGTWGISISGNAGSTSTFGGVSSDYYFQDRGTLASDTNWNLYYINGATSVNEFHWTGANTPPASYKYGLLVSFKGSETKCQIYFPHSPTEELYTRMSWDGTDVQWTSWKTIALTSSNVASATQLQTARTIWGQSFDGTGNVSGDMTGVGSITASGNILAAGAITAGTASDLRLKDNIATLVNASSVLRQLRGVGFAWNALATDKSSYFKGHDVGLIAQEVEPLIPSAIGTIWGEYKRLDYAKITPYLVEGWKEHDTEINRLRNRVLELESEVNKLRQYVN